MGAFFKKNWKWFGIGTAAVIALLIGILALRVFSFVDDLKANRVSDATPTVDTQAMAQVTATALARRCAVVADCTTASPGSGSVLAAPTVTPLAPTATPDVSNSKVVQRIKGGERVTVMYMGYGGPGHEGEYLTDTILVLSYDPKSQTVAQFNIPRDLYLSVPGGPGGKTFKTKVNGIFSLIMKWDKPNQDDLDPKYHWSNPKQQHEAGANLAANAIQNVLGIKIDYWITMNFDGFRSLIDKMGGVNVCVERSFVDNKYPRNDNDKVDAGVMTVKFDKGCQVMNGERAIQFARSRKSEGLEEGDFARSARQMKVIAAIKEDVLKKNLLTNALSYMDALQGNLRVSMEPDELFALANYFNSSEGKQSAVDLKFDPEIMTGNNFLKDLDKGAELGYVLIPQAGEDKFTDIHTWAKKAFTFALVRREQMNLQVLNATGVTGKANNLADFLSDQGFRQAEPEAAPVIDETVLYDYSEGKATTNINKLKEFLPGLKIIAAAPDKKPYDTAPPLMLYLGKNYKGVATGSNGQGGAVPPTVKP